MMWLLLFMLTAAVVLLPMVPALIEWRWPSDVTPLFIDKDDALDPPFLARAFSVSLSTALALRQTHLGRSPIASLQPGKPWSFDARESAAASSHRVWDVHGDTDLPAGMALLGEVACRGSVRAAAGGLYRALWVRDQLLLPAGCTVLRWAHGTQIHAGPACDLAGRVSADELITVAHGTRFTLLHAPVLRFAPGPRGRAAETVADPQAARPGLPASVLWHAPSARGRCETALTIEAGSAWVGDLVCAADLTLGAGCQVQGSLKAHGALTLGPGCSVQGSVVGGGLVTLQAGCSVRGSVVSETGAVLGEDCVIGLPGRACTVTAPRLDMAAGVVAHGTVWATESGWCSGVEAASASASASAPASALDASDDSTESAASLEAPAVAPRAHAAAPQQEATA